MSREIFRRRAYLLLLVLQTEDEFPVIFSHLIDCARFKWLLRRCRYYQNDSARVAVPSPRQGETEARGGYGYT